MMLKKETQSDLLKVLRSMHKGGVGKYYKKADYSKCFPKKKSQRVSEYSGEGNFFT